MVRKEFGMKRVFDIYRVRPVQALVFVFLFPLSLFLGLEMLFSLEWRMAHDTPLLHYIAFCIDRFDLVPYRDIFENSMPGAYGFHLFIGKTLGYGDLAFRIVDLIWLSLLLSVTWGVMRRFSKRVAWASVILFGASYLQHGPTMSLQRDYLVLLPLAFSIWLAAPPALGSPSIGAFLIGLCFGAIATVKPHLAIGLPFLLIYIAVEGYDLQKAIPPKELIGRLVRFGLIAAGGFVLPVGLCLLWLAKGDALPYLWELISKYFPLYLRLTGEHRTISGSDRFFYLLWSYRTLGNQSIWLAPASLGVYLTFFVANTKKTQRRFLMLLLCLALVYSIYPIFGGQFFQYHWMPFQYFVVLLSALALIPLPLSTTPLAQRLFPVLVLIAVTFLFVGPAYEFLQQLRGLSVPPPKHGRPDQVAAQLERMNLAPGDTVQPLDWTGGAVHGMLLAEVRPATKFWFDYSFYHHVSYPYIQSLRRRFMTQLRQEQPEVMIDFDAKPVVSGADTTTAFPALQAFIDANYVVVFRGDGFDILQRQE
jgi:hypothetical protein